MPEVRVFLDISAQEFLAYYQGRADAVLARANDGRTVQFPARVLRPFLTRQGIVGEFLIRFDEQQKFVAIQRLHEEAPPSRTSETS
ncbi:MAG: DUF2835 family protein [Nitrospirae bacterium]|nr:MAG: DUF2835 family protein [Nitrospirota bacterium]